VGETLGREIELLEKIEEWQAKANGESDPFNKYVSIFIAYNIFYNLYSRKRAGFREQDFTHHESRRATATISLIKADQLFKLIEPGLRRYILIIPVFREEYWPTQWSSGNVPISETLKESFNARNTMQANVDKVVV